MGKKFEKGNPGRPKGAKGKATLQRQDILVMVLGALKEIGGQEAFESWARDRRSKSDFLKGVMGLIPKEDKLQHTGKVEVVEIVKFGT